MRRTCETCKYFIKMQDMKVPSEEMRIFNIQSKNMYPCDEVPDECGICTASLPVVRHKDNVCEGWSQ